MLSLRQQFSSGWSSRESSSERQVSSAARSGQLRVSLWLAFVVSVHLRAGENARRMAVDFLATLVGMRWAA